MSIEEVARAETERGELVLRRRTSPQGPSVLELRVNGVFVMDTRETSSEIALAEAALDLVTLPRRVLVGGLGLGFTTQRVLADSRVEHVAVVEIEEPLIGWMRDGVIEHGPALFADQRLQVINADIAMALAEATSTWDLILLDVDNGPGYLVHDANAAIYQHPFLEATRPLVNPGGALVVWSASPAPDLQTAMEQVFGNCTELRYGVRLGERDEEYLLYLSRR